MTAVPDPRVDALLAQARGLIADGRLGAEPLLDQALALAPDCAEAWSLHAHAAQARGDAQRALECLQQACRADPRDPRLLFRLGAVAGALGYRQDALRALEFALELAPNLHRARLKIGQLLEAAGDHRGATRAYLKAIVRAQFDGQWLDDATLPPALRDAVLHASEFAKRGRVDAILGLLEPLIERYGRDEMRRVERALRGYLELESIASPDPRQKPKFLYCPDLPTRAFFDRASFPWFEALEAAYADIRAEAESVLGDPAALQPFLTLGPNSDPAAFLAGGETAPGWDAYFFYRHGLRYDAHHARCPRTSAALEASPLVRIADHAPEICFSVLTPGSHILPHHGVTNVRVVVHLPLIVPEGCTIRVAGEDHRWREGQCVAFDDTFLHEAWNPSGDTRAIVLMDAWNPYLSEAERRAFAEVVEGVGDFHRS